MAETKPDRFLRPRQVAEILGISRTTLWRMRRDGEFPDPVRITKGAVGWRESTLDHWTTEREAAQGR